MFSSKSINECKVKKNSSFSNHCNSKNYNVHVCNKLTICDYRLSNNIFNKQSFLNKYLFLSISLYLRH